MKLAITGAHGYLGRHILQFVVAQGYNVLAIDRKPCDSLYGEKCLTCDIFSDPDLYSAWGKPDTVIHLAWQDNFNHSAISHIELLSQHYTFCKTLMDEGCSSLSVMGSMHEVGYYEGCISEKTPCNPLSLYAIAKNALRQSLEVYAATKPVSFKWLRGFYLTGDDLRNQSVFTKILQAAHNGSKSFPFNDGTARYDFSDVDVAAKQIASAALQTSINGIINICSGVPISLKERTLRFLKENNLDIQLELGKFSRRPYDSPILYGDASRIQAIMGKKA